MDNCNGLGKLIAQRPISVAIEATNWNLYEGGVFSSCGTKMNAMALLVGVTEGNWKIKNSWGTSWGEGGYIRLSPGNTCGVCSIGLYPIKWSIKTIIKYKSYLSFIGSVSFLSF